MKPYSFLSEFGMCAAGLTGVESLATKAKTLTSTGSLLKHKPKKVRSNVVKKSRTGVKSLVR